MKGKHLSMRMSNPHHLEEGIQRQTNETKNAGSNLSEYNLNAYSKTVSVARKSYLPGGKRLTW